MNDAPVLDRLLDDASQFPPGNLALEPAWDAHRRWRQSKRAYAVGRFLVPSARATALAGLIERDGADGIELGIVVGTDQPGELSSLIGGPARVSSVELRGAHDELERWRAQAPEAEIFLEGIPVETVAQIRARDPTVGAKLRCGGLEAAAFPSTEAVASFIEACVRLDVPFKATAGLHQPLRHWDAEIGTFHHGFLNLLAATALAAGGAQTRQLVDCLEIEDPGAWRELDIRTPELHGARRWFTAFGTCSIEEPLDGLAAIGLVDG
jgi:hypothetical protein